MFGCIKQKTKWDADKIIKEHRLTNKFYIEKPRVISQPELGFIIGFNEPKKLYKPYIIVHLFVIRFYFGFLLD